MSEETTAAPSGDTPSLDQVLNDNFGQPAQTTGAPPAPGQAPAQDFAQDDHRKKLEQYNKIREEQKLAWRQEQKLKKEREALKKERADIDRLRKNPKELFQSNDINSIIDQIFETEREEVKNDKKDDSQLYEEIEKRVYEKLKAEQNAEKEKESTERELREFDSSVKDYVSQNPSFQLVNAMGEHQLIREVIEADFKQNSASYGPQRAQQMMMNVDQAAERVEKYLESQIKTVVDYPGMREYLSKLLGAATGQVNSKTPVNNRLTLNNDMTSPSEAGIVDERNMSEREAFNKALSMLK
jgi:small-conductance mechanosensitive channel